MDVIDCVEEGTMLEELYDFIEVDGLLVIIAYLTKYSLITLRKKILSSPEDNIAVSPKRNEIFYTN